MAQPRLLLLDEPAAGLNDTETAELATLLRAIRTWPGSLCWWWNTTCPW